MDSRTISSGQSSSLVQVRPHYTSLLLVDSADRDDAGELADFQVSKKGGPFNMLKVGRYAVIDVNFHWNFTTFNKNNRDIILLCDGVEYPIQLPETDFYYHNYNTVKTALQDALRTAPTPITNDITVIFTTPFQIPTYSIVWPSGTLPWGFVIPNGRGGKGALDVIGISGYKFNPATDDYRIVVTPTISNPNPEIVTSAAVNLVYTRYVDVVSQDINTYNPLIDEASNPKISDVLCRIFAYPNMVIHPILPGETVLGNAEYGYPHYISYQISNLKWMDYVSSRSLGSMRVQVFDDAGNPAPFNDRSDDFQLTLLCESE